MIYTNDSIAVGSKKAEEVKVDRIDVLLPNDTVVDFALIDVEKMELECPRLDLWVLLHLDLHCPALSPRVGVLFHLLVLLEVRGVQLSDVLQELASRRGLSGHAEKARRPKTS